MNRRWAPLVLVLSLTVGTLPLMPVSAFGFSGDKKDKPPGITEFRGKNLSQWIKEIENDDPAKATDAIHWTLFFGPERAEAALTPLLNRLQTPKGIRDDGARAVAVTAVGLILASAKERDQKRTEKALKVLIPLLGDPQSIVRLRTVEVMGQIRLGALVTPDILPLLRDPDSWEVRQAAVNTLLSLHFMPGKYPDPKVFDCLFEALNDPVAKVQDAAAQAIAGLGVPEGFSDDEKLVSALKKVAAQDPDPNVSEAVDFVLKSLKTRKR